MKKFAFIAIIWAVLLSGAAYAQAVSENYSTGEITISGTALPNSYVGLQIMKKNKDINDFLSSPERGKVVEYNDQAETDGSGKYTFVFSPGMETGEYNLYICAFGMTEPEHINISYVNPKEYEEFITTLNSETDFDSFFTIIDEKKMLFGTDVLSIAEGDSYKTAMQGFYEYIKKYPLTTVNSDSDKKTYNTYVVMHSFGRGEISDIENYLNCVIMDEGLSYWVDMALSNKDMVAHIKDILKNRSLYDMQSFEDAITEAVILSVVKYPGGYENVKKIVEQYKTFLSVKSVSDKIYKKVAGNSYKDKTTLKQALSDSTASVSQGGGNGGSGGASNYSSTVTSTPTTLNQTDAEQPQKIDVSFEDIDSVQWANEAITALYDKKIISGKEKTRFCPNDYITREEFVKIIVSVLSIPVGEDDAVFSDVSQSAWYSPYVNAAYKKGIVSGIDADIFGIGQNITRQDMAVIIFNGANASFAEKNNSFADESDISDYALGAVNALSSLGIINGNENKEFMPKKFATRAEAAKMIYQSLEYLSNGGQK